MSNVQRFIASHSNYAPHLSKTLAANTFVEDDTSCWVVHDPKVPKGFVRHLKKFGSGRFKVLYKCLKTGISISSKVKAKEYLDKNTGLKLNQFDFSSDPKISRYSKKLLKKDKSSIISLNLSSKNPVAAKPSRFVAPLGMDQNKSKEQLKFPRIGKSNAQAFKELESDLSKLIENDKKSGKLNTPARCPTCLVMLENANAVSNHHYAIHQFF